jgi:hypothetical protein
LLTIKSSIHASVISERGEDESSRGFVIFVITYHYTQ